MALKLLQPGIVPMGQFDIDDAATKTSITGGELMSFQPQAGTEKAAADVGVGTPAAQIEFAANTAAVDRTQATAQFDMVVGFLADEGIRGYGTLFGSLIGAAVGQATQSGTAGGAVVIGPSTHSATDKVTLHHSPGLYGFSAPVAGGTAAVGGSSDCWSVLGTIATNTPMSTTSGKWLASSAKDQSHCIMIGAVKDGSLVSTTNASAGTTQTNEYFAMYYLGALGAVIDVA